MSERALWQNLVEKEYTDLVLAKVPLNFLVVRENRDLVTVNPALSRALNRTETESLPEKCYCLFGYDRPCWGCTLPRCVRMMDEVQSPLVTRPRFGSVRYCTLLNFPLRTAGGADTGLFMEIIFDETEETLLRQRLEHDFNATITMFFKILLAQESAVASDNAHIAGIAMQIGRKLGLSKEDIRELRAAALLHNLGKISLYQDQLRVEAGEPSSLLEDEEDYAARTADLLSKIETLKGVSEIIRYHRLPCGEDGGARPMPLGSGILRLAILITDYFPSVTNLKTFDPMSLRILIQLVRTRIGTEFDVETGHRFVELFLALQPKPGGTGVSEGGFSD